MGPCYGSDLGHIYCTKMDSIYQYSFGLGWLVWVFVCLFKGLEMQLTAKNLVRPARN